MTCKYSCIMLSVFVSCQPKRKMSNVDRIHFKINGVDHSVGNEVTSDVMLLDYVRYTAGLYGTKYMCREGGCGACIVSVKDTPDAAPLAVNSCLVSITSCHNWDITTIEKLGNQLDGYHPLQKTLADNNGTQCGYCSPGWIMSMYSLLQSKKDMTMLDIEKLLGGNICRCTGYRPILQAFKKFAKDAPDPLEIPDIEDLQICNKTGKICKKTCADEDEDLCIITHTDIIQDYKMSEISLKDGKKWFRAQEIVDIFNILDIEGDDSYMLIAGNTAKGAYPINEYPRVLIDVSGVIELKGCQIDQNLIIGAGTTLTDLLNICDLFSKEEGFEYLGKIASHLQLVAHVAVRNLGSIAGNLMIKYQHNKFPSDVFLLLETVGAFITIRNSHGLTKSITMQEFLKVNMKGTVIINILLPPLSNEFKLVTYKIMPRSINVHAIINAGFLYQFNDDDQKIQSARIVFGGISANFVRAALTELFVKGKMMFTNDNLQSALNILKNELTVEENPPELPADYRKQLAMALFYKGLLTLCPMEILGERVRSGSIRIRETRPVSISQQSYDTDSKLWPLTKPVHKVEALIQCSGEASYTEDLPILSKEVYAAFVLSTIPTGKIVSIDTDRALKQTGIVAVYTAKDIPGLNTFTPLDPSYSVNEEILCSNEVKYYNQPVAIVVAESTQIAERVAKMVTVSYSNVKKPIIDIKDAKNDPNRHKLIEKIDATDKGNDVIKKIKCSNTIYSQCYYTMETLTCVTRAVDNSLEVYSTSQFLDAVQVATMQALNIDENRIDVFARRLGGAYGSKISRNTQVAVACNLVAYKLNRPCRFVQSLTTNSRAMGKRFPCSADFEVAISDKGVIQYMNFDIYEDNGYIVNEKIGTFGIDIHNSVYDSSRWNYKCYDGITDTAKNSYFRAPGSLETIAMVEGIMERISYEVSIDSVDVRFSNIDLKKHSAITEMCEYLKNVSEYDNRKKIVLNYNKEHRWKKRGLRFSFLRWVNTLPPYFDINIAIYHGDGSVTITHGGIEMGQGINTKAVQICAYFLNVPLKKIQVKRTSTITSPNSASSGSSVTSQHIGVGVQIASEKLSKRLEPIRKQKPNATWKEIIKEAYNANIDLQAHGFVSGDVAQKYDVYGITLAEVEVDILTGETEVLRVDVLEDAGQSVNPYIDVGQVEGAFIMGLGYWMTENLTFDKNTGELLTDRTWNYYVPLARDIPQDFRVYFRKNSYGKKVFLGSKRSRTITGANVSTCSWMMGRAAYHVNEFYSDISIGEPPLCMAIAIPFAIREAITAARLDSGISTTTWFDIDGPYTIDKICMAAATKIEEFKFY